VNTPHETYVSQVIDDALREGGVNPQYFDLVRPLVETALAPWPGHGPLLAATRFGRHGQPLGITELVADVRTRCPAAFLPEQKP